MRKLAALVFAMALAAKAEIPTTAEGWYTPEGGFETTQASVSWAQGGSSGSYVVTLAGGEWTGTPPRDNATRNAIETAASAWFIASRNAEKIDELGNNLNAIGLSKGIDVVAKDPNGEEHTYTLTFEKGTMLNTVNSLGKLSVSDPSSSYKITDEKSLFWNGNNKAEIYGWGDAATVSFLDVVSGDGAAVVARNGGVGNSAVLLKWAGINSAALEKSASDGTLQPKGWSESSNGGLESIGTVLGRASNDKGTSGNYKVLVKDGGTGVLRYVAVGDAGGGGAILSDESTITTNSANGALAQGQFSLYGASTAVSASSPAPQIPHLADGNSALQWGSLSAFMDEGQFEEDGTSGLVGMYGFTDADASALSGDTVSFAAADGGGVLSWKELDGVTLTLDDNDEVGLFGFADADAEASTAGSVSFAAADGSGELKWLSTDGNSIGEDDGTVGLVGFATANSAASSESVSIPVADGSDTLQWGKLDGVSVNFGTDDKIGIKGWNGSAATPESDAGSKIGEILSAASSDAVALQNAYAVVRVGNGQLQYAKLGSLTIPQPVLVDGTTITTNSATGAMVDGRASIYGASSALADAASDGVPQIPYLAEGRSVTMWGGVDTFLDEGQFEANADSGKVDLYGFWDADDSVGGSFMVAGTAGNGSLEWKKLDEVTLTVNGDGDLEIAGFETADAAAGGDDAVRFPTADGSGEMVWAKFDANTIEEASGAIGLYGFATANAAANSASVSIPVADGSDTLQWGKLDGVSVEMDASGVVGLAGFAPLTATPEADAEFGVSVAQILTGANQTAAGLQTAYSIVRYGNGHLGYAKFGGIGSTPQADGVSITTNSADGAFTGGNLSLYGAATANTSASENEMPYLPYFTGTGTMKWGSLDAFLDEGQFEANADSGKVDLYGFWDADDTVGDGGGFAVAGSDGSGALAWKTLDGATLALNEDGEIELAGFAEADAAVGDGSVKFAAADGDGELAWLGLDEATLGKNDDGVGIKGFDDANTGVPAGVVAIPVANGGDTIEWAETDGASLGVNTTDDTLEIAGWNASGSPTTESETTLLETLMGAGDETYATAHAVVRKSDGGVGYMPIGGGLNLLAVDGKSLTTNTADGAAFNGKASLYGFATARTDSEGVPQLAYAESESGDTLQWGGLDTLTDEGQFEMDSTTGKLNLYGFADANESASATDFWLPSLDGTGYLGWQSLADFFAGSVFSVSEETGKIILNGTSEQDKVKVLTITGESDAQTLGMLEADNASIDLNTTTTTPMQLHDFATAPAPSGVPNIAEALTNSSVSVAGMSIPVRVPDSNVTAGNSIKYVPLAKITGIPPGNVDQKTIGIDDSEQNSQKLEIFGAHSNSQEGQLLKMGANGVVTWATTKGGVIKEIDPTTPEYNPVEIFQEDPEDVAAITLRGWNTTDNPDSVYGVIDGEPKLYESANWSCLEISDGEIKIEGWDGGVGDSACDTSLSDMLSGSYAGSQADLNSHKVMTRYQTGNGTPSVHWMSLGTVMTNIASSAWSGSFSFIGGSIKPGCVVVGRQAYQVSGVQNAADGDYRVKVDLSSLPPTLESGSGFAAPNGSVSYIPVYTISGGKVTADWRGSFVVPAYE